MAIRVYYFSVVLKTLFYLTSSVPSSDLYTSSPAGNFIGYGGKSWSGKFFVSFSGIRYAQAPVDELRLRDPVPYEYDPEQIVNATTEGPFCMQSPAFTFDVIGEEDCLFLNIYTPNVTGKAPVIMFIYGGAYWDGSCTRQTYAPEYFLDENIVLVTINYRLGALGFTSTEDQSFPGNLGQKDMAEAVKWLHKNIGYFGGDPDNINLMGQSSGAVSVTLLMKTPQVKHLIKRGIAQSGSKLTPWGFSYDYQTRNKTIQLASLLDCPTDSDGQLFNCLQGMTGKQILAKADYIHTNPFDMNPLRPVPDPAGCSSIDAPLLIGFTDTEALYFSAEHWANHLGTTVPALMLAVKPRFTEFLVQLLALDPESPPAWIKPIARAMTDFYWGGMNETSNETVLSVLHAISDIYMTYPVYREAQLSKGPLYTYFFNFTSLLDVDASMHYGTTHADDLKYFFSYGTHIRNTGSASDREESIRLVKIWAEFASGRNPTPNLKWKETSSRGGYLEISNSGLSLVDVESETTEMPNRLKFWANLLKEKLGQRKQNATFSLMTRF